MTISTRRLARRCRERLATDAEVVPTSADPMRPEPPTTVEESTVTPAEPQENVDAT